MRRLVAPAILLVLVLILILSAPPTTVRSQESSPSPTPEVFDYERAYKDLVYTQNVYQKAHSDYLLARSQYMQAKTLAAQTKARDATAVMLGARDNVIITYLAALRMRLTESVGVSDTERDGLNARIDSEVAWFETHRDTIPSAGTLDDLVADSEEATTHFQLTEPVIYEVLSAIPLGKVEVMRSEASGILRALQDKIAQVRLEGNMSTSNMERWVLETQNKLTRSLDKETEAQAEVAKLPGGERQNRNNNRLAIYNGVVSRLDESAQFIREANSNMREIVSQIKTAQ